MLEPVARGGELEVEVEAGGPDALGLAPYPAGCEEPVVLIGDSDAEAEEVAVKLDVEVGDKEDVEKVVGMNDD